MKNLTITFALLLALLCLAPAAQAQTAITATTLNGAMVVGQGSPTTQTVTVTSATGMAVNGILWIEGSVYRITAVSGTSITILNTYAPASHLTLAVVYVVPVAAQIGLDPTGSCIRGTAGLFPFYSPFTLMFNTSNGHIAICRGNLGSRTWAIVSFNQVQPTANPPTTP